MINLNCQILPFSHNFVFWGGGKCRQNLFFVCFCFLKKSHDWDSEVSLLHCGCYFCFPAVGVLTGDCLSSLNVCFSCFGWAFPSFLQSCGSPELPQGPRTPPRPLQPCCRWSDMTSNRGYASFPHSCTAFRTRRWTQLSTRSWSERELKEEEEEEEGGEIKRIPLETQCRTSERRMRWRIRGESSPLAFSLFLRLFRWGTPGLGCGVLR